MKRNAIVLILQSVFLFGFSLELILSLVISSWLYNESRPIGECLEDIKIEAAVNKQLSNDSTCEKNANLNATTYRQLVLLTGQAKDDQLKQKAYDYAIQVPSVKCVVNQITLNPPTALLQRIQDRILFEIIRIKILGTGHLHYSHFKICVENQEVFILGKASSQEANRLTSTIQKVMGVKKIITLIELA